MATGAAVVLVDKLGRKILLVSSAFIMAITLFALGVYFYLKEQDDDEGREGEDRVTSSLGWLPLVSTNLLQGYNIYFCYLEYDI